MTYVESRERLYLKWIANCVDWLLSSTTHVFADKKGSGIAFYRDKSAS